MKDPICGMQVAEPPKILAVRNGVTYGFCSENCRTTFEKRGASKPMEEPVPRTGYAILFGAILSIVLFTFFRRQAAGDWSAVQVMADIMAGFFLVFGSFKLLDLNAFADAYMTYDLIAARARAYGILYPFLQITLGLCYLNRSALDLVNPLALAVMTLSSLGVAKALLSKKKIKCACLGTKIKLPMSTISLVEDVSMALMALGMLLGG